MRQLDFKYEEHNLVRPTYIETGTFLGDSLENAYQKGFQTLHSIECYLPHYEHAIQRFRNKKEINLHWGASPEILVQLINLLQPLPPTTFWLDAHYQGGKKEEQDETYGECPLLLELEIIFAYNWSPIILIDDAHMFQQLPNNFNPNHWPNLEQIKNLLPHHYNLLEKDNILFCLDTNEFKIK